MTAGTLAAEDYFHAALQVLGEQGSEGLTIAALCARLRVTKGSFYHHFTALPAFVDALFAYWDADQAGRLTALARPDGSAQYRLESLVDATLDLPHDTEAAIRAWGMSRPDIADVQARVDRRRERRAADTLVSLGVDRDYARRIARVGLNALIGAQLRGASADLRRLRDDLDELSRLVLRDVPRARAAHRG